MGGGGIGLSYNAIISCVNKWFPGRTGMASGILLLGFGVGGLALGSIVNSLTGLLGITHVFAILGVMLGGILFALSFAIKAPETSAADGVRGDISVMLKTPTFWLIFVWVCATATGAMLIINSAATIAVYFGAPAVLGLVVSVFNGIGRPLTGVLHDQIGRPKALIVETLFLIFGGVTLLLGAVSNQVALIFIGLPLTGIASGGSPTLMIASIMGCFGARNFSVNIAIATFGMLPGAILGPLISRKLQEISGGSYLTTFVMLIVVGVISLIITLVLNSVSKSVTARL
jgi:OFA family oxalate/formate antiporter-like MFS transporter